MLSTLLGVVNSWLTGKDLPMQYNIMQYNTEYLNSPVVELQFGEIKFARPREFAPNLHQLAALSVWIKEEYSALRRTPSDFYF